MDSAQPIERAAPDSAVLLGWLVGLWVSLVAGLLFWLFRDYGYDDPYITYRYAGNLASGAGFVYNAGERILSTTTPLYTLILAAAGLLGADIPLASNLIGSICLALGGLAFWRLGQAWQSQIVGALGLLLYPLFPLLITTIGAESALYIALVLFGFLAYAHERYTRAAVLLALAALVRADGVLAAAVVGVHFLVARRRPVPWRAIVVYGVVLAPWFIFAWTYFGAPLPATLAAKQRQGMMAISQRFFAGLLSQGRDNYWRFPIYRPYFVCAVLGLIYGLVRQRAWLLVVGWSSLYIAAYSALGVTSYFWYYAPVVPGFVALIGLGVAAIHQLVAQIAGRRWAAGAAALLALALFYPQTQSLRYLAQHPDTRMPVYHAAGTWLRDHTPASASVGTIEVGIIGYYAERRMVDFAGLIQPEVALRLTPTGTYDDAALWAIRRFMPDYLVLRKEALPRVLQDPFVAKRCRSIQSFSTPMYAIPLVIYSCSRT